MKRTKMVFIVYSVVLVLAAVAVRHVGVGVGFCLFRSATGIPCPGCGGTRVAWLLMQGRVGEALCLNPLSVAVVVAMGVGWLWLLVDCCRGIPTLLTQLKKPWRWWVTLVVVVVIVVVWVRNICHEYNALGVCL